MSIRMHTKSIVKLLFSDTVEERSAECPDTINVLKKLIHLHTRIMKNLEYINTLVDERPNKRTHPRSSWILSRSPQIPRCKSCVN